MWIFSGVALLYCVSLGILNCGIEKKRIPQNSIRLKYLQTRLSRYQPETITMNIYYFDGTIFS